MPRPLTPSQACCISNPKDTAASRIRTVQWQARKTDTTRRQFFFTFVHRSSACHKRIQMRAEKRADHSHRSFLSVVSYRSLFEGFLFSTKLRPSHHMSTCANQENASQSHLVSLSEYCESDIICLSIKQRKRLRFPHLTPPNQGDQKRATDTGRPKQGDLKNGVAHWMMDRTFSAPAPAAWRLSSG